MAKERVMRVTDQEEDLLKLIRALNLDLTGLRTQLLLTAAAPQPPDPQPDPQPEPVPQPAQPPQPQPQPVKTNQGRPCPKCDSLDYHMEQRGKRYGLYCENGHWQKWLSKKEQAKYQ